MADKWQIKVVTTYDNKPTETEFFQRNSKDEIYCLYDELRTNKSDNEEISKPFPLKESLEEQSNVDISSVQECASNVMEAYQNANKWLDSIKEILYTDLGCVFFSSYIHNLAHTMPVRFDEFGDILHTIDMKIPYPSTQELEDEPTDVTECFEKIFSTLDSIRQSLNDFIDCTEQDFHGLSCASEELLNDIESEYPSLYRMRKAWESSNEDTVSFDKWVHQYVEGKDKLTEAFDFLKNDKQILTEQDSVFSPTDFEQMYLGSWFTVEGAGGDIMDWVNGLTEMLQSIGVGTPQDWMTYTGEEMNTEYGLTGNNKYPNDLTFLSFSLDGLDTGKLAPFKLKFGARWFDDIVDNNRTREQE